MENVNKLLKDLCETVECLRCSSFYTNPEQSDCGHIYCHDCWRNYDQECLVCERVVLQRNLRSNSVLQQRTEHIKELLRSFQQVTQSDRETNTTQNSLTTAERKRSTLEKEVFPNVPSVQNTYVNRRKKRQLSEDFDNLVSASQIESPLILPGENVSALHDSKERSKDTSPHYLTNVQHWLQSSDNKFTEGSQIIDTLDIDNFKKETSKTNEKSNIEPSKVTSIKKTAPSANQQDWDKIEILDSADEKEEAKGKNLEKAACLDDFDNCNVKPRRSLRSKKVETEVRKNVPKLGANVVIADVETHFRRDTGGTQLKRDSRESEKEKVTKQSWNNVKKMKKEFSKLKKPNVKKLNISIESCKNTESVISKVRTTELDCIKKNEISITIDDNSTPPQSSPSPNTHTSSNDKDKNAFEEVFRVSELENSQPEKMSPIQNASILSDPPLTRFSTPDTNFKTVHKLKAVIGHYEEDYEKTQNSKHTGVYVGQSGNKIFSSVEALQKDVIDSNRIITNNFSTCSSATKLTQSNQEKVVLKSPNKQQAQINNHHIDTQRVIEIPETIECSDQAITEAIDPTKLSESVSIHSGSRMPILFQKLGKLAERTSYPVKHIPFYYRADCGSRKITRADNEVVIRIEGNNVSIKVVANPDSVNIESASKAVQTELDRTSDYGQIEVLTQKIDKDIQCNVEVSAEKEMSVMTEKKTESIIKGGIQNTFKLPKVAINIGTTYLKRAEAIENSSITDKASTIGMTNSCKVHQNTASVDTVTAGPLDKISASDEREISEHLDCFDEDIFNSGSVVEEGHNIAVPIKQPSEVLFCTTRTQHFNKKIQNRKLDHHNPHSLSGRRASKRVGNTDDSLTQPSKKTKLEIEKKLPVNPTRDTQIDNDLIISFPSNKETSDHSQSLLKSPPEIDSEPMNYDEIIGNVFASIDADINKKSKNCVSAQDINSQVKENDQNITNVVSTVTIRQPVEISKFEQNSDNLKYLRRKNENALLNNNNQKDLSHRDLQALTEDTINPNFETIVENKICSENMFSVYEKTQGVQDNTDDMVEPQSLRGTMDNLTGLTMHENLANLLTPQVCKELEHPAGTWQSPGPSSHTGKPACIRQLSRLTTPKQSERDEDSEGSIVEETPQKNKESIEKSLSRDSRVKKLSTIRSRSSVTSHNLKTSSTVEEEVKLRDVQDKVAKKKNPLTEGDIQDFINMTNEFSDDSSHNKGKESLIEIVDRLTDKPTLETPLTINRFANEVQYKSTPMQRLARKSLNFNKNPDVQDITDLTHMCDNKMSNVSAKSSFQVKATLEKEFMEQAFDKTPQAPLREKGKARERREQATSSKQICLACSCLPPVQVKNVKTLAMRKNWMYIDTYTDSLTHLIVGVDEANASQRSVKYMCALAAGKWIVSFEWVMQCLKEDRFVEESPYEALDNSGANGPQLSRNADQKLFHGITFYCMPPFSILSEDVLASMLKSAGGRVVKNIKEASVKNSSNVSILLAEPENTQEDRFIDIAVNNSVVPVNFEWVLNCLGCYSVLSVKSLLLCPDSLPHIAGLSWPEYMLETTSDDELLSEQ